MKLLGMMLDVFNALLALILAPLARVQARLGAKRLPLAYGVWDRFKVSPVSHHYYQPIFDVRNLPDRLWAKPDEMAGVQWNEAGQLALLRGFSYQDELKDAPVEEHPNSLEFFHNRSYGPVDAEMLYNMVRHFKPKRVVEIGSGYSTRMMKRALDKNGVEGKGASHTCIEPYEMPWLESMGLVRLSEKRLRMSLWSISTVSKRTTSCLLTRRMSFGLAEMSCLSI